MSIKNAYIFETVFKFRQNIPEYAVILVDLPAKFIITNTSKTNHNHSPYIALFIGEYPEKKLAITVGYVGLGHHDIVARGEGEEGDNLPRHAVVGHV